MQTSARGGDRAGCPKEVELQRKQGICSLSNLCLICLHCSWARMKTMRQCVRRSHFTTIEAFFCKLGVFFLFLIISTWIFLLGKIKIIVCEAKIWIEVAFQDKLKLKCISHLKTARSQNPLHNYFQCKLTEALKFSSFPDCIAAELGA